MKNNVLRLSRYFLFALIALQFGTVMHAAGSSTKKPKKDAAVVEKEAIALYNKGTELLFEGEYKAGEKQLEKALDKKQDFAEAHNNLAFALRKQGKKEFKNALKHYNKAIKLDPKIAEARMYRGVLYVAMGDLELAKADHKWLEGNSPKLAAELAWVIKNGTEKEPAQFFGVTKIL